MTWNVIQGDCLEIMRSMPDNSVDAVVTDPPYGLAFMNKEWDKPGVAYQVDLWQEVLRVLKPGGHLLAFGGTRTYHRMACAIEDAGFEIRDSLMWVYGSGMPKSHDVSKAIDKMAGAEREVVEQRRGGSALKINGDNPRPWHQRQIERGGFYDITAPATPEAEQWHGFGTALKPSHEPIVMARKPLAEKTVARNVLRWGCGGLNVDGCRIDVDRDDPHSRPNRNRHSPSSGVTFQIPERTERTGNEWTVTGRWPANVILDEHAARELDAQSGVTKSSASLRKRAGSKNGDEAWATISQPHVDVYGGHNDSGGASRFFYVAKASKRERNLGLPDGETSTHPTVKPIKLMEWLVRLVTPPDGTVLDPFTGSGSTGVASVNEGFSFIGIEQDGEYAEISRRRIEHAANQVTQLAMVVD